MAKKAITILSFLVVLIVSACQHGKVPDSHDIQIAFLADVHLQDIYGKLEDNAYPGVFNPHSGKYTLARTMEAQLHSTRLFNENYFAFLAALDDVVKRGVKYVVLPGDFSDDGQPLNVRGFKQILDAYTENHGLVFISSTGNHDPVRPFAMEAGKTDFLGEGGKEQAIVSAADLFKPQGPEALPAIITSDLRNMGYREIIEMLGNYGFFPKEEDLYWETPFSTYGYDDYEFDKAMEQASFENRSYAIPPFNSPVPDVSYLVEPSSGLWFLALDANVYIPRDAAASEPDNPLNYNGASVGYNQVMTHKKHLIAWLGKVTADADRLGKTLIVFSHYPMVDFNDDASESIEKLLGQGKMQLSRVPAEDVAQAFAGAGIKIHFGGHMHINDTGVRTTKEGSILVNIQVPSLAAYIPAYKLLTVKNRHLMEIQTIVLDSVPRFNELFPLYEMEHAWLTRAGSTGIWNSDVLLAKSYRDLTQWHLKELVRLRFLPTDWPEDLKEFLMNSTGKDLLLHAQWPKQAILDSADFENWTGFDLVYDFYRLRSADRLALQDIGPERIAQYRLIFNAWQAIPADGPLNRQLKALSDIFDHFLSGKPADHFQVNLDENTMTDLSHGVILLH